MQCKLHIEYMQREMLLDRYFIRNEKAELDSGKSIEGTELAAALGFYTVYQ
jgi:hypothetical protein